MSVECTLEAYTQLDPNDLDATRAMLDACLSVLLAPELWWWMIGLSVFFVLVGAAIGHAKGRVVAGVVWSAVLGPFGWLVVALMPSARPAPVAPPSTAPPAAPTRLPPAY